MPLIADICPHCRRVTRCQVFDRAASGVGISVMGIPLASIPVTSTFFVCCGECGGEFKSRTWDERRAVSPAEAMAMETDQILSLTNPVLQEELFLKQLHSEPRLGNALTLLGKLKPSGLQEALRNALLRWRQLDEGRRDTFLTNARRCDAALGFAQSIASQSKPMATGVIVGLLVGAAVGTGCRWALGPDWGFWSGGAGFVAGVTILSWIWSARDQRWISDVLIPQADREGIHLGWFLHLLQEGGLRNHPELKDLCELAGVIQSKLVAEGRAVEEPAFIAASNERPA